MKERTQRILAHSSIREYESDPDVQDRYYIPWRVSVEAAARINRREKVELILPQHKPFEEFMSFLERELLEGTPIPRIYTSDTNYLMDVDIKKELSNDLAGVVDSRTVIHPYQATPEFFSWARPLQEEKGVEVFGDKKEMGDRAWWGQKGAYHRWIDDLGTASLSEKARVPFPRGYVVSTKEQVLRVAEMLGTEKLVLKPIYGAGGFQIGFIEGAKDLYDYEWPLDPLSDKPMPIAVQEMLQISKDDVGEKVYSLQFNGGDVFGSLTRQLLHDAEWSGNMVPSGASSEFEFLCVKYAKRLLALIQPKGSGGIDYADVGGNPVILEVNGGRPTGAHSPKHFKESFAPNAGAFIFEKIDPGSLSAHEAWDLLKSRTVPGKTHTLGFDKTTQTGVFPIVWLQNSWGMIASMGNSEHEVQKQLLIAKELLIK